MKRKMKKLVGMILAVSMVLGMSMTALAAPTSMQETSGNYTGQDEGEGANAEIDVNGQINRAAKTIQITLDMTDVYWWVPANDQEGSEWSTSTGGYNDVGSTPENGVSVSTKDVVVAPTYTITNNSGFAVDVALYDFTSATPTLSSVAMTTVPSELELNLKWDGGTEHSLMTAGVVTGSYGNTLGSIATAGTATFTFTGTYTGGTHYTDEVLYDDQQMVLNFKAQ